MSTATDHTESGASPPTLEDVIRPIVRRILREEMAKAASPAPIAPTLSPAQAAELLGIPESTVRERVRRGTLPKVPRLGRTVRIPRAAVEALLK